MWFFDYLTLLLIKYCHTFAAATCGPRTKYRLQFSELSVPTTLASLKCGGEHTLAAS